MYFVWINKASFLTYSYTALIQSEFTGLWVDDPNNVGGPQVEAITLMPSIINNGLSMATNIGILCGQWGCIELLKWVGGHAPASGVLDLRTPEKAKRGGVQRGSEMQASS